MVSCGTAAVIGPTPEQGIGAAMHRTDLQEAAVVKCRGRGVARCPSAPAVQRWFENRDHNAGTTHRLAAPVRWTRDGKALHVMARWLRCCRVASPTFGSTCAILQRP